jgi:hypothetical protein
LTEKAEILWKGRVNFAIKMLSFINSIISVQGVIAAEPETIEQIVEIPKELVEEQGIVVVHCRYSGGGLIRVWRSTFLLDHSSNHRSKLLHAENISLYPVWTPIEGNSGLNFTLYFEALPKGCTKFDLHEIIPQSGGFFVEGITRNDLDVYRVEIT